MKHRFHLLTAFVVAVVAVASSSAPQLIDALDTSGTSGRIGADIETRFGSFVYSTAAVSHNAEWMAVRFDEDPPSSTWYLISADTGRSNKLPSALGGALVSDDGRFTYRAVNMLATPGDSAVQVAEVGGSATIVPVTLSELWSLDSVLDVDAEGRIAVLRVNRVIPSSSSIKTVLFDLQSEELLTPLPKGLPDSDRGSSWGRISDDGRTVVFNQYIAPGGEHDIVRVDRRTGNRDLRPAVTPIAHVSDNGEWATWSVGLGTVHSSDDPAGSTSNVNFGPGSVDPNVAFAKVGADGQICFTNSEHGPVDLVLDQLVVGAADAFRQPSDRGAVRLADTRLARF